MRAMLTSLSKSVRSNKFLQRATILAGGAVLGQVIVLASTPITSRLYSPADFGLLGVLLFGVSVFGAAVSLRLETALVSTSDDEEAVGLATLTLAVVVVLAAAGTLALFIVFYRGLFGTTGMPSYAAWFVFPLLLAVGVFSVAKFWLLRQDKFGLLARVGLVQSGAKAVVQVGGGLVAPSFVWLVIGELAGRWGGIFRAAQDLFHNIRRSRSSITLPRAAALLKKHKNFAFYSLPSSLIDVFSTNLILPAFNWRFGFVAAGHIALTQRVLFLPASLIGASVADVFHRDAGEAVSTCRPIRRLFWRTARSLFALSIVPSIVVAAAGGSIFAFVFGEAWREAGRLASLMTPWIVMAFVVGPLTRLVFILNGQRLKLIYDLTVLGLNLSILVISSSFGLSIMGTMGLFAFANTLAYLVYFYLLTWLVREHDEGITCVESQG